MKMNARSSLSVPWEAKTAVVLWLVDVFIEGVDLFLGEAAAVDDQSVIIGCAFAVIALLLLVLEIVQAVKILLGVTGAVRILTWCLYADLLLIAVAFFAIGKGFSVWEWFIPSVPVDVAVIALLLSSGTKRWVMMKEEAVPYSSRSPVSVHMKIAIAIIIVVVAAFAGMILAMMAI